MLPSWLNFRIREDDRRAPHSCRGWTRVMVVEVGGAPELVFGHPDLHRLIGRLHISKMFVVSLTHRCFRIDRPLGEPLRALCRCELAVFLRRCFRRPPIHTGGRAHGWFSFLVSPPERVQLLGETSLGRNADFLEHPRGPPQIEVRPQRPRRPQDSS